MAGMSPSVYRLALVVLIFCLFAAEVTDDAMIAYIGLGYAMLVTAYLLVFDRRALVAAYRQIMERIERRNDA